MSFIKHHFREDIHTLNDQLLDTAYCLNRLWIVLGGNAELVSGTDVKHIYDCHLFRIQDVATLKKYQSLKLLEIESDLIAQTHFHENVYLLEAEIFSLIDLAFLREEIRPEYHLKTLELLLLHYSTLEHSIQEYQKDMYTYIDENISEISDLAFLAKKFKCSLQTIHRKFKADKACSPADYISEIRLQKSIHLIEETETSIQVIAQMVGFKDSTSFSHFFKRKTKNSPLVHRNAKKWLL